MAFKIHHNTLFRLISGLVLVVFIPGLLFLAALPFSDWRIALCISLVFILFVAYGSFFGWRRIIVKRATCSSSLLPEEFDGYRILQMSDIHIGTFLRNPSFIDKLVAKVNDENADLIVFTGDLVNVGADEVIPFMGKLNKIKASDGIFSIMGNHDYCEYGKDNSARNIKRHQTILHYIESKIGWRLLMNEHVMLTRGSASIALIGVENIGKPPFNTYGNLPKAMKGLPYGMFKVLLSHDPTHWRRGVLHKTDIALTLSGHTHAGQIKIGKFSPAKWAYNEWGGKYVEGGSMLYVSLGIGGAVPFRFGAWPEINVITLTRSS